MCGRYTVNTEDEIIEMRQIIKEISIRLTFEDLTDYSGYGREAYPSCIAPVITQDAGIRLLKWGFEKWDGKGVIFNARSETVATSRLFSPCLGKGRCIIPAEAYYEWQRVNGKPGDKYRIYSPGQKQMFMAGLMKQPPGKQAEFVVITRPAAENIRFIHDRMPLIFGIDSVSMWLAEEFRPELLGDFSHAVAFERAV